MKRVEIKKIKIQKGNSLIRTRDGIEYFKH